MKRNRLLRELVDAIARASEEESLKTALSRLTLAYGYDHFAFVNLHATKVYALSNYPDEWQDIYLARSYMVLDPVVTVAKRIARPFEWSNDRQRLCCEADVKRFCEEAASYGIRSGISIPVRTGLGRIAILTLASSRDTEISINADFDVFSAAAAVSLLHAKFPRPPVNRSPPVISVLNSRETACLKWVAEGKRPADIAIVEGIKYSTVRFHIEKAKAKLSVETVAHATALATKLCLI